MGLSKKETRQNTKNRNLMTRPSSQIIECLQQGHKKTPRAKSMTSPPRLVRFMTWCLLQI